jgi:predicted ATPase
MKNKPFVKREVLRYKRGAYGSPFNFLDFENGKGYAINNEEDFDKTDEKLRREEQSLDNDMLAIKGVGLFRRPSRRRPSLSRWKPPGPPPGRST